MRQLATVIEAPIKGALGTEINVGDTVMVVTTGYSHSVRVKKGVYKGYIAGSYYTQRARIEVEEERSFWVFKETGEEYSYYKHGPFYDNVDKMERKAEPYVRKSTLNLNRIATITPAEAETVDKLGKLV
jgi:hypothetical protein